jgi:hypothetical protein
MPELSVGMTTGAGDGTVGGYVNTRMTAKDLKSIGAGVLSSMPAVTGTGTSTLTIDVCDINVNGYFYQNTTALTISVSAVSPGLYDLICRVNDTGSAATVIRSASGTTIPLRSVRLCLVDANTAGPNDVKLTLIQVLGGVINLIFPVTGGYAVSATASKSDRAFMQKTTTQTITNANVATNITWNSLAPGSSGIFSVTAPDTVFIYGSGAYMITGYLEYPSGSTGSRTISIDGFGGIASNVLSSIIPVPSSDPIRQHFSFTYSKTSGGVLFFQLQVTASVAGETITAGNMLVVRL